MDEAARHCDTPYVFFLDSDCDVQAGGFLELMLDRMASDPRCYAVGKMTHMDRRGFDRPPGEGALAYIRPVAMLLRREMYLRLKPFERHGAPCLNNMADAHARGFVLSDFPIDQYIVHEGRGTAGRHGYNLGWKGKINHLLHKLGF